MRTPGKKSRAAVERMTALYAELRLAPGLYAGDVILGLMVAASKARSRRPREGVGRHRRTSRVARPARRRSGKHTSTTRLTRAGRERSLLVLEAFFFQRPTCDVG